MVYETRPIIPGDVTDILRIERECFKHPWELSEFIYLADNHGQILTKDVETYMLVAISNHTVLAYIVWRFYQRDRIGHLLNIAVDKEYRRMGIARSLMNQMFSSLIKAESSSCFLEVRESNTGAQAFYEEMKMTPLTRRRHYYGDEDAIIYQIIFSSNS